MNFFNPDLPLWAHLISYTIGLAIGWWLVTRV